MSERLIVKNLNGNMLLRGNREGRSFHILAGNYWGFFKIPKGSSTPVLNCKEIDSTIQSYIDLRG